MTCVPAVTVEISPAELIDRLSILELKLERIADAAKLANIRREHEALCAAYRGTFRESDALCALRQELGLVNARLWDVEDAVRECDRARSFGARFVALARSVYRLNDQRGRVKRDIDVLLGARFRDEKSYELPRTPG